MVLLNVKYKKEVPERYFYYFLVKLENVHVLVCLFRTYMFMRKRFKKGRRVYYHVIISYTQFYKFPFIYSSYSKRAKVKNVVEKRKNLNIVRYVISF